MSAMEIDLPTYLDATRDGKHAGRQNGRVTHWEDVVREEFYKRIPILIVDKSNGSTTEVILWVRESRPADGIKVRAINEDNHPPIRDSDEPGNNRLAGEPPSDGIEIRDLDGHRLGSIGGLDIDVDDFKAALSKNKPSDERYAYWVSLSDGDLTVRGSKFADRGIEVGTGGTATVNSGKGDDLVRVWHEKDVVFNGGKGSDTISFSAGMDITPTAATGAVVDLTAGTGTNPFGGTLTFTGVENAAGVSDKANVLTGNGKANQLISGYAADTIKGEGGDDTIVLASTFDTSARAMDLDGGSGVDSLWANLSDTDFVGSGASLRFINTLDVLNPANNTGSFRGGTFTGFEIFDPRGNAYSVFNFAGSDAAETVIGLSNADHLDGRGGKDTLTGKAGKDHFVFSTALGATNVDTIKDFKHGTDKIDLDDAIFAALGSNITSGEFIKVSSGHAARQSDDHLIYNTTDGTLWFDRDGTGNKAAVKFAVLTGSPDGVNFHDFDIV